MRTDDIVQRIRSTCPGFAFVAHALTSGGYDENTLPAAFVAPVKATAQPPGMLGVFDQRTEETVGVFIILRRTLDTDAGQGANDDVDDLRQQLKDGLLNWTPPGADEPLYYAGGQLAERNGLASWREDFATTVFVRKST